MPLRPEEFTGWLPAWVRWEPAGPALEWCYTGGQRPDGPFFEQSVQELLRHPFNQLFRRRSALAEMELFEAMPGAARPAGFVFHMSRCGSTLFARMLASLPRNIVLPEPAFLESLLLAHIRRPKVHDRQRIDWLRRALGAAAMHRFGAAQHLFVKLDCWCIGELPLLQAAFPGVPCLFLYRDPIEVLVSHQRQPGMQMLPCAVEPELFGMDRHSALALPGEEYRARVLAALCGAALRHAREGRLELVHYRELPGAVPALLRHRFGIDLDVQETALLHAAARVNAKNPASPFVPDGGTKQAEATLRLRAAAETHVYPIYRELESARACQALLPSADAVAAPA